MRIIFTLCICWMSICLAAAQQAERIKTEIDKLIHHETEIDMSTDPGYVIGVVIGDSTYTYQYGSITKDSFQIPTDTTIFEIGGMTKVFTATLVQSLVEEGQMHYDSSLNFYLSKQYRNPDCDDIKIRQLIQHTSGLPRMPMDFGVLEGTDNNPYLHYSREELIDFYKKYQGPTHPGVYLYSNLGYGLLQLAIESVTQKDYETLLKEKVLKPLQLNTTSITIDDTQVPNVAQGYALNGKPTPLWTFQSFHASEGLKSTMSDILRWTKINMGYYYPDGIQFFEQLQKDKIDTRLTPNVYVAYGWHIIHHKRPPDIVIHPGSTSGFRSFAAFVPASKTAVVILTNSEYGTGNLGQLILRMINNNWKKKRK